MLSKRLWTESSRSTNKIFGFLYFLAVSNVLRLSVGCVLSSNIVFLRHKGIGRHQPWGRLAVIDNPHGADHDRSTGGRFDLAFHNILPSVLGLHAPRHFIIRRKPLEGFGQHLPLLGAKPESYEEGSFPGAIRVLGIEQIRGDLLFGHRGPIEVRQLHRWTLTEEAKGHSEEAK